MKEQRRSEQIHWIKHNLFVFHREFSFIFCNEVTWWSSDHKRKKSTNNCAELWKQERQTESEVNVSVRSYQCEDCDWMKRFKWCHSARAGWGLGSQIAANQRGSQRLTKQLVLPLPSCKTICQTPAVPFWTWFSSEVKISQEEEEAWGHEDTGT